MLFSIKQLISLMLKKDLMVKRKTMIWKFCVFELNNCEFD
jgi:hypothetical protein